MPEREFNRTFPGDEPEDGLERAQISAADVDSAGRSCLFIVAMAVVIMLLLAVWILVTRGQGA